MAIRASSAESNPLSRLAAILPADAAQIVGMVARIVGAAAVLWYAYDQYDAFDGRYFPRTWAYTVAVAVLAVASLVPVGGRLAGIVPAAGASLLFFAGAILSRETGGVIALIAGLAGWLAIAAANEQRGRPGGVSLLGLGAGAGVAFALVLMAYAVNE